MTAVPSPLVTRFAPSPTGFLHLGHAHAALFAARAAAAAPGGRFLVRIEDIDASRCRPEYTAALLEDLAWLGLHWEAPVRHQSAHLADFAAALERLADLGLLYPCFCTRGEIARQIGDIHRAPHGPDGVLYPGTCRAMEPAERAARRQRGESFALRLDMAAALALVAARGLDLAWLDRGRGWQQARPERFGDVVLARKDTPTSYHLAVTVDDALQGITLVTRGVDLFAATDVHRLLQALLGLPVPEWHHHDLLAGPDGRRYAKRDRALTLRALRAAGHTPAEVRAMAGFPAG